MVIRENCQREIFLFSMVHKKCFYAYRLTVCETFFYTTFCIVLVRYYAFLKMFECFRHLFNKYALRYYKTFRVFPYNYLKFLFKKFIVVPARTMWQMLNFYSNSFEKYLNLNSNFAYIWQSVVILYWEGTENYQR